VKPATEYFSSNFDLTATAKQPKIEKIHRGAYEVYMVARSRAAHGN
jgi:hypothetical protein